jgi:DNA-binding transcriptional LysR family regulator
MSPADRWSYRIDGEDRAVPIRARLAVSTAEAGIDAAIAGIGITRVLSYQAAAAIKAGKLKLILRTFELPEIPVSLVHPEARLTPPKVRAFLDFAAPRVRQRLSAVQV